MGKATVRIAWLAVALAALAGGCRSGEDSPRPTATCRSKAAEVAPSATSAERYAADLAFIARPRPPGSAHWLAVQDLCASRLAELGYEVSRQRYGSGVNVIGSRGAGPAGALLLAAHYDGIDASCPAADDDASGVAGVLELARILAGVELAGTVVVACLDEEETTLGGSRAFAAAARGSGTELQVAVVLDGIAVRSLEPGTQRPVPGLDALPDVSGQLAENRYRGDFIAVISDDRAGGAAACLQARGGASELPVLVVDVPRDALGAIEELRRSDHASFWDEGYSALLITDTCEYRDPRYHCSGGDDDVSHLDLGFAMQVLDATAGMVVDLLGVQ